MPEGYSYESLQRGYEATTSHHKTKALVDMANSPSRDDLMYERLDPEYIKDVKRERRRRNKAEIYDYLPNNNTA